MDTNFSNEMTDSSFLRKPENFVPNITKKDSEEMKKILSSFYNSINDVVENIVTESKKDKELETILETNLNNSISINEKYEIRIRKENNFGSKKNFFDIYNKKTNECLCKDIFLFEIAEKIVELLNDGEEIYGPKIRKIFYYEQLYVKHRQDAAIFKKRIEDFDKIKNKKKMEIYKLKYEEAKNKALMAKEKIKNIK